MAEKLDTFEYGRWKPLATNEPVDPRRGLALYTDQGDYELEVFNLVNDPIRFYVIEGALYFDSGEQLILLLPESNGLSEHHFHGFRLIQNQGDHLVALAKSGPYPLYFHLNQQAAPIVTPSNETPDSDPSKLHPIQAWARNLLLALLGK